MSREGSVRRPDFWTASFKRSSSMAGSLLVCLVALPASRVARWALARTRHALHGNRVAAIAGREETRYPADGRNTHTGQPMDLPIREPALQKFDHAPAIRHRLDLRWRTQIAEKCAAFIG